MRTPRRACSPSPVESDPKRRSGVAKHTGLRLFAEAAAESAGRILGEPQRAEVMAATDGFDCWHLKPFTLEA